MDNLNKTFYKIREVAEILNVPASTLRFWETKFTVISPRRNSGGTRFYTADDIEKIRMIHYLVKEKGLKLDAAQEQLMSNREGVSRQREVVERLKGVRASLNALLETLNKMR